MNLPAEAAAQAGNEPSFAKAMEGKQGILNVEGLFFGTSCIGFMHCVSTSTPDTAYQVIEIQVLQT